MTYKIVFIFFFSAMSTVLFAVEKEKIMTAEQKLKARAALLNKLSGTLATSFETNLYKFSDKANKTFTNLTLARFSFASDYDFTTDLTLILDKNLRGERKQALRDPAILLKKSFFEPVKNLKIGGGLSFVLPLSDNSKDNTELHTSVSVGPRISLDASEYLFPGLSFSLLPSYKKFFHKYKVSVAGKSNTDQSTTTRFVISYGITEALGLALDNIYVRAWTYDGRSNDQFFLDQSLGYTYLGKYSVSIGHSLGGSALDVNGQESDVRIFDSRDSTVYMGFGFKF